MPPRDSAAEANIAVLEQPRSFELVGKAMEERGIKGVIEFAKQEADDQISGIHSLGSFDAQEEYPGSAVDVLKMKAANEDAVKQVQEAQHVLELDLSEFDSPAAVVETPKVVEAAPAAKVEAPAPVIEAPVEQAAPQAEEKPVVIEESKAEVEVIQPIVEAKPEALDELGQEQAKLDAYEAEMAQEKKTLEEFNGAHTIGMTPLEQKYAASLNTHILHLGASVELTKLYVQKMNLEKQGRGEDAKHLAEAIQQTEAEVERLHTEAEKVTGEYEKMLAAFMNQPVDEEVAQAPVIKKEEKKFISSEYPLPKGGDTLQPKPEKKPGALSKLWSKVWGSMKFWEIK